MYKNEELMAVARGAIGTVEDGESYLIFLLQKFINALELADRRIKVLEKDIADLEARNKELEAHNEMLEEEL